MFKIFRAEVGFRDMGLNVTWATAYSDEQFSFVASQTKKPMSKGAEEEGRSKEGMLLRGSWFPGQLIEGGGGVGREASSSHQPTKPSINIYLNNLPENFQSLQVPRLGLQVTNGARARSELFVWEESDWQPASRPSQIYLLPGQRPKLKRLSMGSHSFANILPPIHPLLYYFL